MSNDGNSGMTEVRARSTVKVDERVEGMLTLNKVIKARADEDGRLVLRVPGGGSRADVEVVLGGPLSAPRMADYLRHVARDLDRMHADYHHTGSGILRQIMDEIRKIPGAGNLHLDSVTFKGMGGLIQGVGTDAAKIDKASKMLMHSFRGLISAHMEPVILRIIRVKFDAAVKHNMKQGGIRVVEVEEEVAGE